MKFPCYETALQIYALTNWPGKFQPTTDERLQYSNFRIERPVFGDIGAGPARLVCEEFDPKWDLRTEVYVDLEDETPESLSYKILVSVIEWREGQQAIIDGAGS